LELSNQAIGRAGEFQAASVFELHGVVTTHVDVSGVDLWCETPSGRRVTVQVKTTRAPTDSKQKRSPRYFFQIKPKQGVVADIYCFVALDLGRVRLLSSGELIKRSTRSHPVSYFTEEDMVADIKRYLY